MLEGPVEPIDAESDSGKAQKLAGGEARRVRNAFRERRLVLLPELDDEAADEIHDYERRDHHAAGALLFAEPLVDEVERSEHGEAEEHLCDLRRVAQRDLVAVVEAGKPETPV